MQNVSDFGSQSFRQGFKQYKEQKAALKESYREQIRDSIQKALDEQRNSSHPNKTEMSKKLRQIVNELQEKYTAERQELKNAILGQDVQIDDTLPDLKDYYKSLVKSKGRTKDTSHVRGPIESIKDQELTSLRQKYQKLVYAYSSKYYDFHILPKIGQNKVSKLDLGNYIMGFKNDYIKPLQTEYFIERENALKNVDANHRVTYGLHSTASDLNIYFDCNLLPLVSSSLCLLKGRLAILEVYEKHVIAFFRQSADARLSKRRVIEGLETLQEDYIRMRESFKCSVDETHIPDLRIGLNESYMKILSEKYGHLMNEM